MFEHPLADNSTLLRTIIKEVLAEVPLGSEARGSRWYTGYLGCHEGLDPVGSITNTC